MRSNERLDLTSLKKALAALQRVTNVYQRFIDHHASEDELEAVKSGVIQHFEFSYELSWKFIKRWLMINISPDIADGITRRELFRLGAENKLIDHIEQWMIFHGARNSTSHTYDQTIADEIFDIAYQFIPYAQNLLTQLEKKVD
jgi:nucleotidyltransferase substrate binding protein (TIGR01987 family)